MIFADILSPMCLMFEIGPFMPHSSVFIETIICAFYGPKCKKAKKWGKKSFNVLSVKLFSIFFSTFLGFFILFCFVSNL